MVPSEVFYYSKSAGDVAGYRLGNLSNFHEVRIMPVSFVLQDGSEMSWNFPTVEHAFQAGKCL